MFTVPFHVLISPRDGDDDAEMLFGWCRSRAQVNVSVRPSVRRMTSVTGGTLSLEQRDQAGERTSRVKKKQTNHRARSFYASIATERLSGSQGSTCFVLLSFSTSRSRSARPHRYSFSDCIPSCFNVLIAFRLFSVTARCTRFDPSLGHSLNIIVRNQAVSHPN